MIEVHIGEAASYAAAGVDIDEGDKFSQMWHEAARQTYNNRQDELGQLAVVGSGSFGIRGFDLDIIQGQHGLMLMGGVDGAGTKAELGERSTDQRIWDQMRKVEVAEEHRDHRGIFVDVTAMVVDDISRDGGEPFGIATLFDVNSLKNEQSEEVVRQLCEGAVEACKTADVVYFNGETAELGNRVGGFESTQYRAFNYNLGGFALGVARKDRALTGEKVQPGDAIIALRERGFRANGMSLVRNVLTKKFGPYWHLQEPEVADQALRPSTIYTPAFVALHGGYKGEAGADVHALVHVTGGGIPGKLQRKLAVTGHGAVLEDLFEPPEIMSQVQDWSMEYQSDNPAENLATPDKSMYQALNGGIGGLVITPDADQAQIVLAAHGIDSQIAGEVVEDPGIEMVSKGVTHNGERIRFVPRAA